MNGSGHDAAGLPCGVPKVTQKYIRHLTDKIESNKKDIVQVREYRLEDADYAIITFGLLGAALRWPRWRLPETMG